MKNLKQFVAVSCILLGTLACGGGGKDAPTPTPTPTPTPPVVSDVETKPTLTFANQTNALNMNIKHGHDPLQYSTMPMMYSAGVAVADYDNDGYLDIYFVSGNDGTNHLYKNQGDGTFIETASEAGIAISGVKGSGPTFADIDGDGWLDLFVGAVDNDPYYLFHNNKNGTFTDITVSAGVIITAPNSVSTTFGDIDNDGDLDMFISHWGNHLESDKSLEIVWRNDTENGVIKFVDISTEWGMNEIYQAQTLENSFDSSFVPSLSDIDNDGDIDLLLASDFGHSKVLRNDGNKFTRTNIDSLTDQFGMGSAMADIDNDGDMDWYVTSIHAKAPNDQSKDLTAGYGGNRLYINDGEGNFANRAGSKKVGDGGWAWAACLADFNNDGLTDIFHVNGWGQTDIDFMQYQEDFSRMYLQQSDGTFIESSVAVKLREVKQGRGVSCNDIDRDGDIDIITSNNNESASFYRNELTSGHHYLIVQLEGQQPNSQALGARIQVTSSTGLVQTKELRTDTNFVSMNAVEAHFGFADNDEPVDIIVTWPNLSVSEFKQVTVDQLISFQQ